MTTITFKHAGQAAGDGYAARNAVVGALQLIRREWLFWQASRAMNRLDDAALHDVGIDRGAIDDAVRHGRSLRRRQTQRG